MPPSRAGGVRRVSFSMRSGTDLEGVHDEADVDGHRHVEGHKEYSQRLSDAIDSARYYASEIAHQLQPVGLGLHPVRHAREGDHKRARRAKERQVAPLDLQSTRRLVDWSVDLARDSFGTHARMHE